MYPAAQRAREGYAARMMEAAVKAALKRRDYR
jgi:hypothetical protein